MAADSPIIVLSLGKSILRATTDLTLPLNTHSDVGMWVYMWVCMCGCVYVGVCLVMHT